MMLSRVFKTVAQRSATTMYNRPSMFVAGANNFGALRSFSSDHRLTEKEVTERVLDVISKYDKCSGKSVAATSTFSELGLDSLDSADILVAVEEEFGIEIPDEEADRINSCLDTISYIRKTPTAK
eukprot:gene14507-17124_t